MRLGRTPAEVRLGALAEHAAQRRVVELREALGLVRPPVRLLALARAERAALAAGAAEQLLRAVAADVAATARNVRALLRRLSSIWVAPMHLLTGGQGVCLTGAQGVCPRRLSST